MGVYSMGPPADFILFIRDLCGIKTFVEGGTFQGATAQWAARNFKSVITIELSQQLHAAAKAQFGGLKNVEFMQGHTREVLRRIVPNFREPVVFWLDAHWSGGATQGEDDECPILDEIAIINESPQDHIVLIDDARLFTAPPPAPHKREQWPDIWKLGHALQEGLGPRRVLIAQDVIIAVPADIGERVAEFWHRWVAPRRSWRTKARQSWEALHD